MKRLLPALLMLLLAFVTCKKEEPAVPTPVTTSGTPTTGPATGTAYATGTLTGTITPAGAALGVSMTGNGQSPINTYSFDNKGVFKFTDLPVGTYTLSFNAASNYSAPASKTVTITAGQNTDAGTNTFLAITPSGTITGTVSPAGAVASVTVGNLTNGLYITYTAVVNPSTGSFQISNLPAGSFSLSCSAPSGYTWFTGQNITLSVGQTINIGPITAPATVTTGSITGVVSQPAWISLVTAVNLASPYTIARSASVDNINGKFQLTELAAGTYYLYFLTKSIDSYYAPTPTGIIVTVEQNTDIGTVTVSRVMPGSISGTVSPAGSAMTVTATADGSTRAYTATPEASGNFKIANLPYGKYFVTATPSSGSSLYAPYRKPVSVGNGQDVNIGNVTLTATPPPYPVACLVDGAAYTTQSGTIDSYYSNLQLGINSVLGDYRIIMILKGVIGPGDYSCNSTSGSTITLSKYIPPSSTSGTPSIPSIPSGPFSASSWNTSAASGSGTVKVVSIDPVTKMISGTFIATVTAGYASVLSSKSITSGTFNVPYE